MQGRKDSVIRGGLDLRQADRHRLEFGYVLARPWWGQGLMTEALTEIVALGAFAALDLPHQRGVRCGERGIGPRDGEVRTGPGGCAAALLGPPQHGQRASGLLQLRPRAVAAFCDAERPSAARSSRYSAALAADRAHHQQSISSFVRRTRISRLPTWFAVPTMPSFSICSISLAALL